MQLEAEMAHKKAEVEKLTAAHAKVKEQHKTAEDALASAEDLLQTLLTGLTTGGTKNTGGGYMGQLADAKARLSQAATEEEQNRVKLQMRQKELKDLEARWKTVEREAGEATRNLDAMKVDVEKCRKKLAECGWTAEKEQERETAIRTAKAQIDSLTEVRLLSSHLHHSLMPVLSRNATLRNSVSHSWTSTIPFLIQISTPPRSRVSWPL